MSEDDSFNQFGGEAGNIFASLNGGTVTNAVPAECTLKGEVRSTYCFRIHPGTGSGDRCKARCRAYHIVTCFLTSIIISKLFSAQPYCPFVSILSIKLITLVASPAASSGSAGEEKEQ